MQDKIRTEVVELLKADFGNVDKMAIMESYIFDNPGNEHYNIDEIVGIENEMKADKSKVEAEYLAKVQGTFVVTPAVAGSDDGEGNVTKEVPAVYYKLTTKADLLKELTSEFFDVEQLASDYEDNYGEYSEGRTFGEFKQLANA